jgi:hypothetical protein
MRRAARNRRRRALAEGVTEGALAVVGNDSGDGEAEGEGTEAASSGSDGGGGSRGEGGGGGGGGTEGDGLGLSFEEFRDALMGVDARANSHPVRRCTS